LLAPPLATTLERVVAADSLRARLVGRLVATGRIRSPVVERAFRGVPRHLFLPDVPVEQAYADHAVAIKWLDGSAVSSASQPSMVAIMLEQLDLRPGHRVLEIGAGSGYNAALISRIVGSSGSVVSVDIDQDLVDGAARNLAAAGVDGVRLACGDGAAGFPDGAPFDRLVLTVGSADVQPAWVDQLAPGGRLLLPLAVRGSQLSVALDLMPGAAPWLCSSSVTGCAFIRLRGVAAGPAMATPIGPDGLFLQAQEDRDVDVDGLLAALRSPGADRPSEVRIGAADLWDGLGLWLSVSDPNACRLLAAGPAAELVPRLAAAGEDGEGTLCVLDRTGVAALVRVGASGPAGSTGVGRGRGGRGRSGGRAFPVAIRPFGPGGDRLADRLSEHLRRWSAAGSPTCGRLRVRVYPAATVLPDLGAATVVDTGYTRLLLDWPP
jgi:protein-L-isoaspartate(D-aspartate) O-methyltransferase